MSVLRALPAVLLVVAPFVGCDKPAPPAPAPAPSASSTVVATASTAVAPKPSASASASTSASASGTNDDLVAGAVPPLLDAAGKPLPQTEDKPSLRSKSWEKRVKLLFRAIQVDDPKLAEPAFFPLAAYEQVKAIANPKTDFENRLLKAYARDIHKAHEGMGKGALDAQLIGLEVLEDKMQWMAPGTEGNKVGYFRVLKSKLRYVDVSGTPHAVDVTSLISWRGEWYVVHMAGFK